LQYIPLIRPYVYKLGGEFEIGASYYFNNVKKIKTKIKIEY